VTYSHRLAEYLAVIRDVHEHIGDDREARLARGQFHDVILLGDVAYRFPRDEESRRSLPARAELLRALGDGRLPVAIPALHSTAALNEPLGRCHVALQRVSGEPIERARIVGWQAEDAVVASLARVLDRLDELGADDAIRKTVPRADPGRWVRFAEDVRAVLFPLMSERGRRRAAAELDQVLAVPAGGEALVHGDLGGGNLLWAVTGAGPRLTAILDWDEAQTGNQADDLASIAVTVGWPLAERIDARRHDGGTPTIQAARAIAATFALQQALPAALSGDIPSLDDGLSTYRDPLSATGR
jgi:aminoglycoside phosphotransferase (APT) family kinase protein